MKSIVIGVGNLYRHDDAAGLEVIRRLRGTANRSEVVEHDGEPAGLIDLWDGMDVAFVVDAVGGTSPGRVHRLEIGAGGDNRVLESPARDSSHALGLGDAVELGRALDRLPRRLVLFGIEGADFTVGEGLSEPVERAVTMVTADLTREVREEVH